MPAYTAAADLCRNNTVKDKSLRQKEACGAKAPRSPFVLSLSDF
jgi:hypothetical protein